MLFSVKSAKGPYFSAPRANMIDILPIEKPPYKRSNKPLRRVRIADVIGPKDSKNCENSNLKISDEDIDKLFNSNCGPFVEVKESNNGASDKTAGKPAALNEISTVGNNFNDQNEKVEKDDQKTSVIEVNKSSKKAETDVQSLSGNVSAFFSFLPAIITIFTRFFDVIKQSSQILLKRRRRK